MKSAYFGFRIVRQPNGKFAIYDTNTEEFINVDFPSAEAAKERILSKLDAILFEQVNLFNRSDYSDDLLFEEHLDRCRKKLGLPAKESLEKLSSLKQMGVSVEGTERDLHALLGNKS
jgi:hypothetical protein